MIIPKGDQSEKLCMALERLSGNPDFEVVMKWLGESLSFHRKQNDKLEDIQLYRSQGKCIVLDEILEMKSGARGFLEKIKQMPQKRI